MTRLHGTGNSGAGHQRMLSFLMTRSAGQYQVLVLKPDPLRGEEKGSGHHLTFELSPDWNVDLTNQKN